MLPALFEGAKLGPIDPTFNESAAAALLSELKRQNVTWQELRDGLHFYLGESRADTYNLDRILMALRARFRPWLP